MNNFYQKEKGIEDKQTKIGPTPKLLSKYTAEKTEQVKKFRYLVSMITTDAKCHMEITRRIVIGEETFSKRKELLRGKLDRNPKKWMVKTNAMECRAVWITDMDYEKEDIKRREALEM